MTNRQSKQTETGAARPAPVSLHPLTAEQALGALLRTPHTGTAKPATVAEKKQRRRKGRRRTGK